MSNQEWVTLVLDQNNALTFRPEESILEFITTSEDFGITLVNGRYYKISDEQFNYLWNRLYANDRIVLET